MARDRVGDGVERTGEAEITAVYFFLKLLLLLTVPQVEPRHENMCGASGGNYRFHKAGGKGMGSGKEKKKKKTILKALSNGSRCVCTVTISSVFSYGRRL